MKDEGGGRREAIGLERGVDTVGLGM